MLNLPNWTMINEINILHKCHCGNFPSHMGEKSAGLFSVVSYHHKVIVKLGEHGFNAFAESLTCPRWRSPVLLIQMIWNFQRYIDRFKEIFLDLRTEIAFVAQHHTVLIFPFYSMEIMKVMDTCGSHIIRMYNASYSTDCVELIAVVMQPLRDTVSPIRSSSDIVTSHSTAFCSGILTYFYRFGVDAEYILCTINGDCYLLAYISCKTSRQFTPCIELSTAYQVWQILLALIVQTMKEKIFAVESKSLGCYSKSHDFEIGEFWNNPTSGDVAKCVDTISSEILAYSEDSYEICYEVAHKQSDSS